MAELKKHFIFDVHVTGAYNSPSSTKMLGSFSPSFIVFLSTLEQYLKCKKLDRFYVLPQVWRTKVTP